MAPKPTPRDPSFSERMAHAWKQMVDRVRARHQAPKREQHKQKVKLGVRM
jgi:hypothetical protein